MSSFLIYDGAAIREPDGSISILLKGDDSNVFPKSPQWFFVGKVRNKLEAARLADELSGNAFLTGIKGEFWDVFDAIGMLMKNAVPTEKVKVDGRPWLNREGKCWRKIRCGKTLGVLWRQWVKENRRFLKYEEIKKLVKEGAEVGWVTVTEKGNISVLKLVKGASFPIIYLSRPDATKGYHFWDDAEVIVVERFPATEIGMELKDIADAWEEV